MQAQAPLYNGCPYSGGGLMDLDLSGKHALVCGASEGIGRAAAQELALLGADVTVLSRRAGLLPMSPGTMRCASSCNR